MERVSKATHRAPKQAKRARREPIKVVYISTPVWVEATVAEFRSRVIELTGRDSDVAGAADGYGQVAQPVSRATYRRPDANMEAYRSQFDMIDEVFTPRMMDSLTGVMPSTRPYEPLQLGGLRSFDQV